MKTVLAFQRFNDFSLFLLASFVEWDGNYTVGFSVTIHELLDYNETEIDDELDDSTCMHDIGHFSLGIFFPEFAG